MRFTKQKRHRKIVRFYTACFGFREPYKVLCDGTFIHHCCQNKLSPESTVSTAIASPVQIFTTKCAIAELESLGRAYAGSFAAAHRDYRIARCVHDEKVSAWDCIVETIGENNPEHFFVASQDNKLRNQCQKVPGVPVMYGLRNAIYLDQLSSFQREYVKSSEEERLRMTESELNLLQKRVKEITEVDSSAEDGNGDGISRPPVLENRKASKRVSGVKDKPQFKRHKAKGPNPLSCKKKQSSNSSAPKQGKNDNTGSGDKRSRSRKRKRTRATKTPTPSATTATA